MLDIGLLEYLSKLKEIHVYPGKTGGVLNEILVTNLILGSTLLGEDGERLNYGYKKTAL